MKKEDGRRWEEAVEGRRKRREGRKEKVGEKEEEEEELRIGVGVTFSWPELLGLHSLALDNRVCGELDRTDLPRK